MREKLDLSLCIPTFNKASKLDTLLKQVSELSLSFHEVIIFDNDSTDNTAEIVQRYMTLISDLKYYKQSKNHGLFINITNVAHASTGRFTYIIGDDDKVNIEALKKATSILRDDPTIVCVYGTIQNEGENEDWDKHPDERYSKDTQLKVLNKFSWFALPVMRTEVYQRIQFCEGEGFVFEWTFFDRMLSFGDAVFIAEPLFIKEYSLENITSKIYEPWYQDFIRAEFEMYYASLGLGLSEIQDIIRTTLSQHYVHGFHYAIQQKRYLMSRRFALRAKVYGKLTDKDLSNWEVNHLFLAAIERLSKLLETIPEIKEIVFEDSQAINEIMKRVMVHSELKIQTKPIPKEQIPSLPFVKGQWLFAERYETLNARNVEQGTYFSFQNSFQDILESCRVLTTPIHLKIPVE